MYIIFNIYLLEGFCKNHWHNVTYLYDVIIAVNILKFQGEISHIVVEL